MQYISRIFILVAALLMAQTTMAQPPARKKEKAKKERKAESNAADIELSERAKSQYPGTVTPQEVDWKREVYRELDLKKEKNASLYYPVEPIGENLNLFTFLFQNIINGNITAYKYNLDGNELFTDDNTLDVKSFLENYSIYYEEKDGAIVVGKSDVPSAEILSYYIKESHYYDQRTGTYSKRVTAICPVQHRAGESAMVRTKYPMFWLNYDEVAPMLAKQTVMTSSLNNVASMTLNDYFDKGCYDGEIYKTVNMQNLAITQYCKDSAEVSKEQQKIEQQLKDFRTNLWNTKSVAEVRQDSINAANEAANDSINGTNDKEKKESKKSRRATKKKENKSEKKQVEKKSEGGSKAPRASVRRTRR